ncbi:ATP-binding protein [Ferrimonas pelagia]|uniref:histidine kinase n=1 Tax=Ferrimonas pelagia TaxID=1177826 RepID=A0ABP9F4W3_9GAMM
MRQPNHLFFKLLLAFWITTSLILVLVIGLPYLQKQLDRDDIDPRHEKTLESVAERLERADGRALVSIGELLRQEQSRQSRNKRMQFYVVNNIGQPISTAPRFLPQDVRDFLLEQKNYQQPKTFRFSSSLVSGPLPVYLQDDQYYLIGRLKTGRQRHFLFSLTDEPWALLLLSITFSGLVFGMLAWHLGKPLRHLREAAGALASGDLDARINGSTLNRRDEIGQLGRSFNQMADSVTTMLKGQQRLLSDISHELRTPLTRQKLGLALARKKHGDNPELQRIGREADHLEQMISELLALSRMNMQITERKHPMDLSDALRPMLEDARFEAEQLGKSLRFELPDSLPFHGIETLLLRAVENPLRNALRYAQHQVDVRVTAQSRTLQIQIRDDGPGVPEPELETIFKPFYRVDEARDRDSGGWGLGLAITLGAIEAHLGQIEASNRVPQGLMVTITLPLDPRSH